MSRCVGECIERRDAWTECLVTPGALLRSSMSSLGYHRISSKASFPAVLHAEGNLDGKSYPTTHRLLARKTFSPDFRDRRCQSTSPPGGTDDHGVQASSG